ncbi:glycosyltransferase [Novosphingobium tardum]|uniref:Glycosyltransferase n=1 Tax=Novosphingobium tardum TaxID=1538021 RepID=A0ABV8RKR9_9SPHN
MSAWGNRAAPAIAVVGRLNPANPAPHFATALRERGWRVTELDETEPYILGVQGLPAKLAQRALTALGERELNRSVLTLHGAIGFDAILVLKASWLRAATLRSLRARGAWLANWFPDFDFSHSGFDEAVFAEYDAVITTKQHQLDHLRTRYPKLALAHVEHGYCPLLHRPIPAPAPSFDAIYVGNTSAYKHQLLTAVAGRLPARRFAVAGAGWEARPLTPNITVLGKRTGDEMAAALGQAKLALAFHMGPHGQFDWEDQVSARSFEIPACGVPMLHIDNGEIARWYERDTEYLGFTDVEELAGRIEQALGHEQLCARLAAAALKRAVPAYSYVSRGHEIGSFIEKELSRKAGWQVHD